ncbi:MAG: prenyltransferase [Aigarchaeota archaeon]|nr:prenyltransferase [Aigarchaeota archaeon]
MVFKIRVWLEAIRVKFFLAGIPPVILGTCIAFYDLGVFNMLNFLLTLAGIIFVMIGTYTFNEFFDYRSGVDVVIMEEDITPFNAGSRILPRKLLEPSSVFKMGLVSWIIASTIAVYFTVTVGLYIIPLTIIGFLAGAFYTAPPLMWAYRGLGEVMIGLNYGILIPFGSYYVQTGSLPSTSFLIPSLVPAALITAVIWINEFPDYRADKSIGKNNLVVRLGRENSRSFYIFLMVFSYISILLGVFMEIIPLIGLIALATIPLTVRSISTCIRYYEYPQKLKPAMAGTIITYALTTMLLSISYVIGSVM